LTPLPHLGDNPKEIMKAVATAKSVTCFRLDHFAPCERFFLSLLSKRGHIRDANENAH
jgi:hypothetical protein